MKGRLWRLREHMAPLPSSLSEFSHKNCRPCVFCPLPFPKAFEEQAECAGKARSAWAPTTVRACPTPTTVRARALGTHPLARAFGTHHHARARLWHPPPCARARALGTHLRVRARAPLAPTIVRARAPLAPTAAGALHALGTHCLAPSTHRLARPWHPLPCA